MSATYYIILVTLDLIATVVILPELIVRRIVLLIICIFRRAGAVGASSAKPIDELGIIARLHRRAMPRLNYEPKVLKLQITSNIIKKTEDEKVYLSEEDLAESKWKGQ